MLACDLNVWRSSLSVTDQQRHGVVAGRLRAAVAEIRELPDGLAFRLPAEPEVLALAGEFIGRERACCPFLSYLLQLDGGSEWFWCELSGPSGTREFLKRALAGAPGYCVQC